MININIGEKYKVDSSSLKTAMDLIENEEVILYAMSGKMGAGKDTIGDEIKERLKSYGHNVVSMSYALPIKKEMEEVLNRYEKYKDYKMTAKHFNVSSCEIEEFIRLLNGKDVYRRTDESRLAIQYWGTDVRRNQDTNYWINQLVKMIVSELNNGNSVEISDVRFENEADSILDLNGKIIRIELPDKVRVERIVKRDSLVPTESHLNHISETALDNYKFRRVFDGEQSVHKLTMEALEYIIERDN